MLLTVDADPVVLDRVEGELQRSFGSDFRVRGELAGDDALRLLDTTHELGQRVAVVLVDHALPEEQRAGVFGRARTLHPDARRALLIDWGAWADRDVASAILTAMAVGDISYYVLKPWIERDELFHRTIAEFVQEWSRSEVSNLREMVVVADAALRPGARRPQPADPQRHPERVPASAAPSSPTRCSEKSGDDGARRRQVLVWMPAVGGAVLRDPTDAEIAEAWGIHTPGRGTTATSTCSWSGPDRLAWPPRSTRRRRACGPSWSSASRSAGRPGAAR